LGTRTTFTLLVALLLGSAGAAWALEPLTVEAGGSIEHVWWRDLNGDGAADLMLLVRPADGPRQLAVRYATGNRRLPPWEDQRGTPRKLEELARAALVLVADVCPEKGLEVVFVGADGIHAFVHADGAYRDLRRLGDAPEGLAFALPDDAGLRVWPHVLREGPGRDAIVLPVADGFAVVRFGPGGVLGVEPIHAPPERTLEVGPHDFFALVVEHAVPRFVDGDGDGREDLVLVRDDRLTGHLRRRDGSLPREPSFRYRMSFLEELDGAGVRETFARFLVDLRDVDADGHADLLVTRTRGKVALFASFESQHFLYRGPDLWSRERDDLVSPPSGVVSVGGVSIHPALVDLDGDGRMDLVLTSLKADAIGQHLLHRVPAEYRAYRFDPGRGAFARSPLFSESRRYPVWRLQQGKTEATVTFDGDFDGDGRPDLLDLAAGGEDRIEILRGRLASRGRYRFGPVLLRVAGKVEADPHVLDADGDGTDDLLVHGDGKAFVFYTGKGVR
jgi:hypothetical protein